MNDIGKPKFYRGDLVITDLAVEALTDMDISTALRRHSSGDWGTVVGSDWDNNERSLKEGGGLISAYLSGKGLEFWVSTSSDRLTTTIGLADDF